MSFFDEISEAFGDSLAGDSPTGKIPLITATVLGPLEPDHIEQYLQLHGSLDTTQKVDEKDVQVLRARHHSVARFLAAGLDEGLVAEFTGYTRQYITVLKQSPSMIQLVEHYRAPGDLAARQITERLRTIGLSALERLDSKLETLDNNSLLGLAKLGLDRSGHGPSSSVHNITEHRIFDVAELERLNRSAKRKDSARIVPVDNVRKALPKPEDFDDLGEGTQLQHRDDGPQQEEDQEQEHRQGPAVP